MLLDRQIQRLKTISIWCQATGLLALFILHTYAMNPETTSFASQLKLAIFGLMLIQAFSFAIWRVYLVKKHQRLAEQN